MVFRFTNINDKSLFNMGKIISTIMSSENKLNNIFMACIYSLVYDYMYKNFVYELFHYLGRLDYEPMTLERSIIWILLSSIPFAEYKGINKISSFFSLFLYLFVYIPFIHGMMVLYSDDNMQIYSYCLIMFIFAILYFKVGNDWTPIKNIMIKPQISFKTIEYTTIVLTVIFVAIAHNHMHFVNIFTDMQRLYELRSENSESESLAGIGYLQGWLFGAFYPFVLVLYLEKKKWVKVLLTLAGYILLFMVDMQKMTFLMPFVLIILYQIVRLNEQKVSYYIHSYIMLTIICFSCIVYVKQDNELIFTIAAILLLRTVCVAGWLTQLYIHFFNENPYTYYSHINIINYITQSYPYSDALGKAVAYGTQNANANFFLTDGVAACGLLGICIIGIFFLLLLIIINSITARYKKTNLFVIFMPTISYFLNTSIFTTMLSNGLLPLMLIIACTNINKNTKSK